MSEKVKVIVTGGAGFIGSHLVDALLERGFAVVALDNFVSGRRVNINPQAELQKIDIRDFEKLAPIFRGARFVFHTAALPQVEPSIRDPRTTHDINVNGTLNVLLASRDVGVKRVIYSSSCAVYGDQNKLPVDEDAPPSPLSPYALQKLIGELKCRLFSMIYNLETVSLRYFNVYGPRAAVEGPYACVIGKFLEQHRRGEPLTVVPDGTQSRDFTHVQDVVHANILAAESPKVGRGEVINIGSGRNYSVLEVARLIGGPKIFIEPRVELQHSRSDIKRAKELLGWEPKVSFEDGIQELKNQYRLA